MRERHGWSEVEDRDAIRQTVHFSISPTRVLSCIALVAEKMDHRPEVFNVHNPVDYAVDRRAMPGWASAGLKYRMRAHLRQSYQDCGAGAAYTAR